MCIPVVCILTSLPAYARGIMPGLSSSSSASDTLLPTFKKDSVYEVAHKPPVPLNLKEEIARIKYPKAAKKKRLEGSVYVKFLINEFGNVEKIKEVKGPDEFHETVIEAAYRLRFEPAVNNHKPTKCWMTIPFNFSLTKSKTEGD
jgi:TonB family protein